MATIADAETRPDVRPGMRVEDVEYQRQGGRALLARLYRPAGTGPYPAVLQIHGGAKAKVYYKDITIAELPSSRKGAKAQSGN